ncbi:MAG: hypothetical protein WDO71_27100 [Bacteroidota bacterium]
MSIFTHLYDIAAAVAGYDRSGGNAHVALTMKIAVGSTCSLPANRLPFTTHSPLNCKRSFVLMSPVTLPTISAWLPLMFPSTEPLAPITILAELLTLPMIVPSIRRSLLLLISPLRVVPVLTSVAPPLLLDVFFGLHVGFVFTVKHRFVI